MNGIPNDFEWGPTADEDRFIISDEIFRDNIYEKFNPVKKGDVVVDIGAHVGSFTRSILDKQPSKVFCVEPSKNLIDVLKRNTANPVVNYTNKSIFDFNGKKQKDSESNIFCMEIGEEYESIRFSDFIQDNQIEQIDFLKCDCESGEYSIFTEENYEFIRNHVKWISGEWHVWGFENVIQKFIDFRDRYLKGHNFFAYDRHGNNITHKIFDDQYINWYSEYYTRGAQFIIWIDYRTLPGIESVTEVIPMIGTAVVSNPRWVRRLIDSVDYPVREFLIINNNGRGEIDEELNELSRQCHPFIGKIRVCHMPSNIGVPASWNLMIRSYINCPYWIIVNDDVAFGPGFLQEMNQTALKDPEVGLVHGYPGRFNLGSWDVFLIRDHIISNYGLFDENLYPAYNEDSDYMMRFIHRPVKKVLELSSGYYHGNGDKDQISLHGSQTKKSDPSLVPKLDRSYEMNIEYLTKKWGPSWRMCYPTTSPFLGNGEDLPVSTTTFDLEFARKKHLGF